MPNVDTASASLTESDHNRDGGLARALRSLRDTRYRWWFLTQIFSVSGSMTQGVAQSWLVLQLTGSALDLGLIVALSWLPVLLFGAWAGGLSDRLDRRHLLLATQSAFVVMCAAQTVLVATGEIRVWMIFVLGALNGFIGAVDGPARQVYVYDLVGRDRLASAVGLYEVILNSARVLGPAAGGVLLATAGVAACFFVNALSFLPTLVVLVRFIPAAGPAGERTTRSPVRIRDGLAVVRRSPEIRSCVLIAATIGLVFNTSVSVPLFASRVLHLGGGGFGAMMACFGIGAVPGALAAAGSRTGPTGARIRVLALLTGVAVTATALSTDPIEAFAGMAVVGFTSIWLIAAANTLVQLRVQPEQRGRIMGIWTMALPGCYPITGLLIALAAGVNTRAALALGGMVMLIVAATIWTAVTRPPLPAPSPAPAGPGLR